MEHIHPIVSRLSNDHVTCLLKQRRLLLRPVLQHVPDLCDNRYKPTAILSRNLDHKRFDPIILQVFDLN